MGDDAGLKGVPPEDRSSLARRIERTVIDRFAPAHVVVDRNFEVQYFSARTDAFLSLPRGAPSSNLLDMARIGLRPGLRGALEEALRTRRPSRREALPLGDGPMRRTVDLHVQPLPAAQGEEDLYLVVLAEIPVREPPVQGADTAGNRVAHDDLRLLESVVREDLRTTIEELEMSNEKVKASNEELLSINQGLRSANQELEVLYDSAPVGFALLDADLRYVRINAALAEIDGVAVEAHLGRTVREVLPDLADRIEPVLQEVLRAGDAAREVEITGRTPADPAAEHTWVSDYYPVLENGQPRAIGMIVRETTELRRSERARRQGDERLRLTLERAPVAVYTCDLNLRYTWEAGAEAQAPFANATGRFDQELLPPQQAAELIALKRKALIDGQPVRGELTLPGASGEARTWELAIEPARDAAGAVSGLLMAGLEITERKRAEEQKLLLLGELNHRVKNTLTAVRSMVMRTLAGSDEHEPLREALVGRLQALARTHDLLSASGWQGAPLAGLIEGEVAPYRGPAPDRVDLDGPPVTLASGAVSILALAFHELTTNAARHGALSMPDGRVSLRWRLEPAPEGGGEILHIAWRETGGPAVGETPSSGFGRQLIERGVTYELGGRSEIRVDPAGFAWEAWLPASRCLRPDR